jgi:hypothetical protein
LMSQIKSPLSLSVKLNVTFTFTFTTYFHVPHNQRCVVWVGGVRLQRKTHDRLLFWA